MFLAAIAADAEQLELTGAVRVSDSHDVGMWYHVMPQSRRWRDSMHISIIITDMPCA